MGLIEIEGMEFYAYHGHYDVEQSVGNRFLVDIKIETDCTAAGKSDNLNDALDYQRVYRLIGEEMKQTSHLLEHVANRILDRLYAEFKNRIYSSSLKISKMNPPMGGKIEKVSIVVSR
ncbi:MAG: dihydroneopterin aldolase [Bacteroidota bacterium]|nr:dihydroneopterin aldolase [Bacteroidota bacterium]MDP4204869.1 dihydroneopterin aldolase [Bacteroidota bacterium]